MRKRPLYHYVWLFLCQFHYILITSLIDIMIQVTKYSDDKWHDHRTKSIEPLAKELLLHHYNKVFWFALLLYVTFWKRTVCTQYETVLERRLKLILYTFLLTIKYNFLSISLVHKTLPSIRIATHSHFSTVWPSHFSLRYKSRDS